MLGTIFIHVSGTCEQNGQQDAREVEVELERPQGQGQVSQDIERPLAVHGAPVDAIADTNKPDLF